MALVLIRVSENTKADCFLGRKLRPDEYLEIEKDNESSYILNSKDLCLYTGTE
jgi:hypothetical protein